MCFKAVDVVMAAHIQPPTLKLTALVMAHMKNAKTGLLNPSMATVAARVGISPGQAKRCVRELKDRGFVSVLANAGGGAPGTTPAYRLHLDRFVEAAQTDSTGAPPTDIADAPPPTGATGGMDAREGVHGRPEGGASMHKTGGTHAPQTEKEQRRNSEGTGVQLDAFSQCSAAVAGSQPVNRPMKQKAAAPTAATWAAYSTAFVARYSVPPVRNAKVNGQLANLVARLGADVAPRVAEFYLAHDSDYYARRFHSVDALLADAEKLRVQMLGGRRASIGAASRFDEIEYGAPVAGVVDANA